MKRLQISTANFIIKIRFFNIFTMLFLFFSAILHQSKENAHMEDKELITNATQLLSEFNKSFQSCKQGRADDIRLQELLNTTL